MDDIYENINDYNRSQKILIILDDFISDIMTNISMNCLLGPEN